MTLHGSFLCRLVPWIGPLSPPTFSREGITCLQLHSFIVSYLPIDVWGALASLASFAFVGLCLPQSTSVVFLIEVHPTGQKPCPHIPLTHALLCPGLLPRVGGTALLRSPVLCPNQSLRHWLRLLFMLDKGQYNLTLRSLFRACFPESALDLIFAQNLCLTFPLSCGQAGNLQAQWSPSSLGFSSPSAGLHSLPQITSSARKEAGGSLPGLHHPVHQEHFLLSTATQAMCYKLPATSRGSLSEEKKRQTDRQTDQGCLHMEERP